MINVEIFNNGSSLAVDIPCLSYGDFDRYGRLPMNSIYKVIDIGGTISVSHPKWLNGLYKRLYKEGKRFYTLYYDSTISKEFHQLTKQRSWDQEFKLLYSLNSLGRSSFHYEVELCHPLSKQVLIRVQQGECLVDYKSKRTSSQSTPVPDYIRNSYSFNAPIPEKITIPETPYGSTYIFKYKILYSDTDFNRHVNMCNYVRFMLDCGELAQLTGFYKTIKSSPSFLLLKRHRIVYLGESYEGDELDIHTWEGKDQGIPTVYFVVVKQKKELVKSSFQFHSLFGDSKL